MSADRVEAQWHLTPRGWEQGAVLPGSDQPMTPADRVLTKAVITTWPSQWNNKKTETRVEEKWRTDDQAAYEDLVGKFGTRPPKTRS